MRLLLISVGLLYMVGCMSSSECGEAECAAFCATAATARDAGPAPSVVEEPEPAAAAISDFESTVVAPILEDIRGGVRPFNEEAIGVCKGKRECDEYLGREVGELPAGDYILQAELGVPNTGDSHGWQIEFATECETVRKTETGETRSTSQNSRTYDVRYAGESRGYRLIPLRTITSPSEGGSRACDWKITAPHPDGEKVYEGSWATPDAG